VTNLDYLYNVHGDVTNLMNSTTIAASYYYDAFGVCTETTYSGGMVSTDDTNPYRYAGYQYDSETQLYYLNSRMYNPLTSRFMQEDTFPGWKTDPLSLNRYTYAHNNPIKYWDPTGHYVSPTDKANLTTSQIAGLEKATADWNKANAAGDKAGMAAANTAANAIRASAGYSGGNNGNSVTVSSGNTVSTVVVNKTTTVNNSGTITTVNVLTGATSTINNSGSIGTVNNHGTTTINNSGSIGTVNNSGSISLISNTGSIGTITNSGNVGTITNSGTIVAVSNSGTINYISNINNGSIDTISNSNTIKSINTGKSTSNITNSGAVSSIVTGSNSFVKVDNTGIINSIYIGSGGTLDGSNLGFVEKTSGGSGYKPTYQWVNSSAKTLLLIQNRFILDYLLTQDDQSAGVGASRIGTKLYKDFSNPINTALVNAESTFGANGNRRDYGWFAAQVNHGADWDIKIEDPWNRTIANNTFPGQNTPIVVNGQIVTPHVLGNMTYGYLGSACGLTQFELLKGGDYANGSYSGGFWGGVWGIITSSDPEEDKAEIKAGVKWYQDAHK
jgi:RHS repeat-associated protein